jgi:hypothetical protein
VLKPEASISVGLATAAVVYSIHSNMTPSLTDVRAAEVGDRDVESSERAASWTAAGVVAGISLIAKDPTVFVIGGAMVIAMSWFTRHANEVDPRAGRVPYIGKLDQADMAEMGDMEPTADQYA